MLVTLFTTINNNGSCSEVSLLADESYDQELKVNYECDPTNAVRAELQVALIEYLKRSCNP